MKSLLYQLHLSTFRADPRILRLAFGLIALVFSIIIHSPDDGSGGVR